MQTNFNHDISGWNTDSAQFMEEMFTGATHF
nr:BspA family leucine-rich repeat surface protein [Mycoplasmopsis bovis]